MRFDGGARAFAHSAARLKGLDSVLAIDEDAQGLLWAGTHTGGLHLFDRDAGATNARALPSRTASPNSGPTAVGSVKT